MSLEAPQPDMPSVSIVIPHFNDLDNLARCLSLLEAQTVAASHRETIVADNNSTCDRDRLAALCQGRARLVDAPVQGAAEARNAGVEAARAGRLAFIDSDCRPAPGWLAAGLAALEAADMVGGRVEVAVADPSRLTPAEAFETVFAFQNERYIREEQFSVTANMFTTRAVFDRVGGFRPRVSEDMDWGRRAVALGFRWAYAPAALVTHPARRSTGDLVRKWRRLTAESFALTQERAGRRRRWLARSWVALLSAPLFIPPVFRCRQLPGLADRMNAVGVLVWLRLWRLREAHRIAWRA